MEDSNTNVNAKNTHHIAVFAFPFASHGRSLLNIVRQLSCLAPRNKLHFSFFSTPNSINSLFSKKDVDCPNIIKGYEIWDGKPKGYVFKGNPLEEIDLFLKAASNLGFLKKVVEEAEKDVGVKVSCVMGDAFLWFLWDLAKDIEVPWFPCWNAGEHSLCIHVYAHLIKLRFPPTQGIEAREEETMDFIPGLTKIRVKDIPGGILIGDVEPTVSQMLHKMSQVLPYASAICMNCCEELDPVVIADLRSKFSKVYTVGPLNLVIAPPKITDSYYCLDWLDKQSANSVIYVSFGYAATPAPIEIFVLAEALQDSGFKFLWSIKDHLKVHLPKNFLEKNREKGNGMMVPWAPQVEVLGHDAVGVFITHFGYYSIVESIAAEVPMLGRPFFGDHKLNARLVEAVWEIGLQVQGGAFTTKEGILKCLDQILLSDQGKEMRANLKGLKELIGKAIAPKGSINQNCTLLLEHISSLCL